MQGNFHDSSEIQISELLFREEQGRAAIEVIWKVIWNRPIETEYKCSALLMNKSGSGLY